MKLAKDRSTTSTEQAAKVVSNMKSELSAATPIDTGLARSSWSVDNVGPVFNVRNSVPYIERLNAGSSEQAPARFIERIALKYGTPLGTIVDVDR